MTQDGVTVRTHNVQTMENEHPVDSDNELKNEHPVLWGDRCSIGL